MGNMKRILHQVAMATVLSGAMAIWPALAADVQVRVLNVADAAGSVRVAVCVADQWLKPSCARGARAPAHPGVVAITVHDVPPGTYGVLAHHDRNDDGQVNRNLLGMPTEGIGFSRDAPMRFGPPHFEDAALQVGSGAVMADVTLRFVPEARRGQR